MSTGAVLPGITEQERKVALKSIVPPAAWVCAIAALAGTPALAQYSSDAANNLTVADRNGDQVQPKVRPTADGGAYMAWYDNSTGGYDVYLQRLDVHGVEQWAHNGLLIADRAVSSTQDYELIVDINGNAVITYNDDGGVSGSPQQISVQRVSPAGALLWGPHGVTLTSGSTFKGPPHITQLTDGDFALTWTDGSTSPTGWAMQVISDIGVPRFSGNGISVSEPGHYTQVSDIEASDNGSYIILWERAFNTSSLSSKYLLAMKYNGQGAPQWTPTPVANPLGPVTGVVVYMPAPGEMYTTATGTGTYSATQGGSIQNGYFPPLLSDGSGGVIIGWYENAGPRNAYIQHIHADGSLQFQMNGVSNAFTALNPGRIRLDGVAAYNPVTQRYYLASSESANPTQGNYSVFAQSFDAAGTRLWGNTGVEIIAPNTNQPSFIQCLAVDGGTVVGGLDTRPGGHVVFASKVLDNQSVPFVEQISSTVVSKSRLTSCLSTAGFAIFAWGNAGNGSDIQVQNVNSDGSLGDQVSSCGTADFDGDADIGTDADIEAFFACLGGNCCATCFPGGADFNADGDVGTDADIEAFFRVLAGGNC